MLSGITGKLGQLKDGIGGKQFLALLLVLVILFAIPLTVYLVKQRQELRSKASGRTLSLEFRGAPQSVAAGGTFQVDLVLQGSSQSTYTGADVTITYPADKVTLVSFTPPASPALDTEIWRDPNPLSSTGTFRYIAVNKGNPNPASFITLGTLTFKMTATTGDAQLSFGNSSQAVVLEEVESFIASLTGGQQLAVSPVTVAVAAGPTNTPTPSPTPSPTPVPGRKVGDANDDKCVNIADYNIWKSEVQTRAKCADWRGGGADGSFADNIVDTSDFAIWYSEWQKPANRENCITPAPNTCLNR